MSLLAGSDDGHDQSDEPWSVLRSVGPDAPTDPRQSDVQAVPYTHLDVYKRQG